MEFNSLEELYNRVSPALRTRVNDFKLERINDIKTIDIWNYLKDSKWMLSHDLNLSDIVNDILTCSSADVIRYKIGER